MKSTHSIGLAAILVAMSAAPVALRAQAAEAPREAVLGIGGLFFRAEDPAALAHWYHDNLGIDLTPTTYEIEPWQQEAGPTVFAPFGAATTYFGDPSQQWMVNFRVRDLDAMVAQLRAAGIEVEVEEEVYPNGRFARLEDPEGNPIQLWEPAAPALSTDD